MPKPKKRRAPAPPRPVQAPQRRGNQRSARSSPLTSLEPRILALAGGAVVVAIAAIVIVLSTGGGSSITPAQVKAAMLAAGCTYRDVPPKPPRYDKTDARGGYHLDFPTLTTPTKGVWSTSPPSGGGHYYLWAVWGFYTSAVNPRQVVHNEEHGAVVIWWGPKVSQATIAKLHAFYEQQPDGVFGTPYPSLGDKIALTAWTGSPLTYYRTSYGTGHIAVCSSFNQKAFATFRSAYRGQGPEGIPLSDDEPGMGPTESQPVAVPPSS